MQSESAYLVGGDKVADEEEDGHHDVLGDRDNVGARDLEDLDTVLDGRVEVDVVGADTSGDAKLEVLGLLHDLSGQVTGVEGSGDQDLSLSSNAYPFVKTMDNSRETRSYILNMLLEKAI